MTRWDLGVLARAAKGQLCGGALPSGVAAVGTDSRSLPPASLFVALRGERFDGHAFVREVAAAGAAAVVVDARGDEMLGDLGVPRLVVPDTLAALGDMAHAVRQELGKPVVAVTGSNGKTTTKEMLASILAERGPVHRTRGNLNNLIGLPLTLFAWPSEAWAGVLEMGMSAPGEIARLCAIADPDVGVITMVGPAHLAGLGTLDNVGRAKAELFAGLRADATAVINADDPVLARVAVPLLGKQRRLTFGAGRADVQVTSHAPTFAGLRVELRLDGGSLEVELPLVGPHNALNAAAAAAAAHALGLTPAQIQSGLAKVSVPGGRLRLLRDLAGGVNVIDDTYNANPASMRAAFSTLASLATGRRVAVLGDMLELGAESQALHAEVGAAAAAAGITDLFALGEQAMEIAKSARAAGTDARAFATLDELLPALLRVVRAGDWLLVKGSRGMKMERVVAHFEGRKA